MRIAFVLCAAVCVIAATASAQAPRRSALSWIRMPGADSCPTAPDVARAVDERLGRSVFSTAADAELTIEGRVEPIEGGFRATVRLADASGAVLGERTIDRQGECAPILGPLALAIALTIDPDAPPPEEHVAEREVVIERVEVPVVVPGPRWRLEIVLAASGAVELLPFVAPGGSLAFFLTPPGFVPILVQGSLHPWSRATLMDGSWIDHLSALGGIGICPVAVRDPRASFLACAGIDGGARVAIGASGAGPTQSQRVLVLLDVAARAHVRIAGPLIGTAALSLLVPFVNDDWAGATGVYWRPFPIAAALELGLGVDLDL